MPKFVLPFYCHAGQLPWHVTTQVSTRVNMTARRIVCLRKGQPLVAQADLLDTRGWPQSMEACLMSWRAVTSCASPPMTELCECYEYDGMVSVIENLPRGQFTRVYLWLHLNRSKKRHRTYNVSVMLRRSLRRLIFTHTMHTDNLMWCNVRCTKRPKYIFIFFICWFCALHFMIILYGNTLLVWI